ncbi:MULTISPECIES: hypothetical protein [unclassified Bradyrhizobium]|nr:MULTISPECIES: hypothetical protein [unclassified Bradyrhizobium]
MVTTAYLLWLRQAIVAFTMLAVAPLDIAFSAVEAELDRRGVEP